MDALVSVFLELVKISLTAGMIAGIILLIRAVIGKKFPRRVCYALWGVVLIRLLFPVSLPSPTSIFTPTEYTPQYTIEQDFRTLRLSVMNRIQRISAYCRIAEE